MSIDIEIKKGSFEKLVNKLMENPKIKDKIMLEKILLEFGNKIDDVYIMLNNEYYEDGNCYYKCSEFIDRYFKTEDSFDAFLNTLEFGIDYKEIWNAKENLGIELPSEEDTEE